MRTLSLTAFGILLLSLCACGSSDTDEPTPTPAAPEIGGTLTLDPTATAEVGAMLWVGFFLEDGVDELGIPIDANAPQFGLQYSEFSFPFTYVFEALEGSFYAVAGLDQNNDGLFCEGEWIGQYTEDAGNGNAERVLVEIGPGGLGGVDFELNISVPAIFEPDECP